MKQETTDSTNSNVEYRLHRMRSNDYLVVHSKSHLVCMVGKYKGNELTTDIVLVDPSEIKGTVIKFKTAINHAIQKLTPPL